jgi:EAL domain-containing protein (putative c-di-GMP-specific phosphodiesterase class I)/AmiR/NasT family two-component response regulator
MLVEGDEGLPHGRPQPDHPRLERFSDARVLVIDDESANVALLLQLLRRAGLNNLHVVRDSRSAMARIEELDPDLVLLDLHMPGVDGYALLSELRDHTGGSYLPVLVLTADTTRQAINRALDLGAQDFLTKPFDIDEVTLRVRNLLETKALHTTLRHHNLSLRRQLGTLERAAESAQDARQSVIDRVRKVLQDDAITMVFQPIVESPSGRLVGCEALARFPGTPQQGPDRWFADADSVGLGTELEVAAVTAALRDLHQLPPPLFLAVNVSPSAALAPELYAALREADCPRIILELTEHVPVEDYEVVNDRLSALRDLGVRLALDDTGAGYAGFRHLLGLRPDVIKLDISLTRDIDRDAVRRALAGALVAFADDVDARVIAEGVENAHELETLVRLRIPWLQGYHLGRPQAMSTIADMATG